MARLRRGRVLTPRAAARDTLYTVAAAGETLDMSYYVGGNGQQPGAAWIRGEMRLDNAIVADSRRQAAAKVIGNTTAQLG